MKGIVVVPAFNEEKRILRVIKKIPQEVDHHKLEILVVNDGSTDLTEIILKKNKVKVISHPVNRGLGAALGTGFEYARIKNYDFLITLDGDGQHDPREIPKLLKPIINKEADFIVGTRINKGSMPFKRRMLTFFATLATFVLTGVWTADSQSGFRIFSKNAIKKINIQVDKMEVSTDFFRQCREKGLVILEVPIKAIYTKYSLTKGQNFFNSFNIVGKLMLQNLNN
ncbi:glycosyltransferase family 2 protein [Candidatus Daviesbacteria bacterium]|nr:glycosyltransferase family 2 protein [Candidatus Daviesbacteria bacterium]